MGKLRLYINALESAQRIEFVSGTALITLQGNALTFSLAFGHAVRTLV